MKNLKFALLIILMTLPLMAFADQEEILITLFIQAISVIIFLIILLFIKLKLNKKGILGLIYVVVTAVIWIATDRIPYRDNMSIINILIAFGPFAAVAITYILLLRNNKDNQRV